MKLHDLSKRLGSMLEARILVSHVTGFTDADIIAFHDIPLSPAQSDMLEKCIEQRLQGRPVSKITGQKEFYGRVFSVTDDVLDPRPDSETLIDITLRHLRTANKNDLAILDLGTGSGCLILTLLAELPGSTGIATDISDKALAVAKNNAVQLNLNSRVQFVKSDWFTDIKGQFDIIISNPPYIETCTLDHLDIDVRDYDPVLALDGGEDGLAPYRVIFPQIRHYLKKGGFMAIEHGTGQSVRIKRLIDNTAFEEIRVHHDLGGHDRVTSAIAK